MVTNDWEKDIAEEAKKIVEHAVYNDELDTLTIKEIKALARMRVYEQPEVTSGKGKKFIKGGY